MENQERQATGTGYRKLAPHQAPEQAPSGMPSVDDVVEQRFLHVVNTIVRTLGGVRITPDHSMFGLTMEEDTETYATVLVTDALVPVKGQTVILVTSKDAGGKVLLRVMESGSEREVDMSLNQKFALMARIVREKMNPAPEPKPEPKPVQQAPAREQRPTPVHAAPRREPSPNVQKNPNDKFKAKDILLGAIRTGQIRTTAVPGGEGSGQLSVLLETVHPPFVVGYIKCTPGTTKLTDFIQDIKFEADANSKERGVTVDLSRHEKYLKGTIDESFLESLGMMSEEDTEPTSLSDDDLFELSDSVSQCAINLVHFVEVEGGKEYTIQLDDCGVKGMENALLALTKRRRKALVLTLSSCTKEGQKKSDFAGVTLRQGTENMAADTLISMTSAKCQEKVNDMGIAY